MVQKWLLVGVTIVSTFKMQTWLKSTLTLVTEHCLAQTLLRQEKTYIYIDALSGPALIEDGPGWGELLSSGLTRQSFGIHLWRWWSDLLPPTENIWRLMKHEIKKITRDSKLLSSCNPISSENWNTLLSKLHKCITSVLWADATRW